MSTDPIHWSNPIHMKYWLLILSSPDLSAYYVHTEPVLFDSFYKKLKNVSCEYDRLNGWNSTFFASCVVHQTRSLDVLILYLIYNMVVIHTSQWLLALYIHPIFRPMSTDTIQQDPTNPQQAVVVGLPAESFALYGNRPEDRAWSNRATAAAA